MRAAEAVELGRGRRGRVDANPFPSLFVPGLSDELISENSGVPETERRRTQKEIPCACSRTESCGSPTSSSAAP